MKEKTIWYSAKKVIIKDKVQKIILHKKIVVDQKTLTQRLKRYITNFKHRRSDVFRPIGRPIYRFGCPNTGAQKTLFKFSFFLIAFQQNIHWSSHNDFTVHLIIISKWLKQQNVDRKKTMRQNEVEAKKETVYRSVFSYLNTY